MLLGASSRALRRGGEGVLNTARGLCGRLALPRSYAALTTNDARALSLPPQVTFGADYPMQAPEFCFLRPAPKHPHIYSNGTRSVPFCFAARLMR